MRTSGCCRGGSCPPPGAREGSGIPGRRTVTAWLLAGSCWAWPWGSPGAGPAVERLGDPPLSRRGYAALVGGRHGPCRNQQQEKHQNVTFQRIRLRWG